MKRWNAFRVAFCIAFCHLGSSASAQLGNGYIGIYDDPSGTIPCTYVPRGSSKTLHVIATLAGSTVDGIRAAEFRIEVENPAGWSFQYSPPAAAITLGDPMDTDPGDPNDGSGVAVAFS